MDRIYGNESGISYCYDNGGVTFYCSAVAYILDKSKEPEKVNLSL